MANNNESTVLTVQVGGTDVKIDSIAKAKKAIKDLNSEVLKGNKEALKSLADVKDRLEDVKEATETVKGSGVEKLTASFSLLSQGFASFDTDKIKTGFKGIGAAMSAVPIFLLIEGVKILIENFDVVIDVFNSFIGVTKSAEIAAERLTAQINAEVEATKNLIGVNDTYTKKELLRLTALGASEKELQDAKAQGLLRAKKIAEEQEALRIDEYNAILRNDRATTEQLKNAGNKLLEASNLTKKTKEDLQIFEYEKQIAINKIAEDAYKESQTDYKNHLAELKRIRKANEDAVKQANEAAERGRQATIKDRQAIDKEQEDRNKLRVDENKKANDELLKQEEELSASFSVLNSQRIKDNQAVANSKLTAEKNAFQGARDLSSAFFEFKKNQAEGDVKKQNELARKAFQVNKAFQIAQATVDGIRGVQGIFASTAPFGPIVQGISVAAATVTQLGILAKLAAVKFQGSSHAGAGAGSSSPGSFNISAPPPPPPQISNNNGQVGSTIINNNGISGPVQAYVVETQQRKVTDRANKFIRQNEWG